MTEDDEKPRKSTQTGARAARLAAALRENLRRRKAQERQRGVSSPGLPRPKPSPAAQDDKNR